MERKRFWTIALAILAVGLERLAWLSLRSANVSGSAIDHFTVAHTSAFRVAVILLLFATPMACVAIALFARTSLKAAIAAGLFATIPQALIVVTLQSLRFRDGYRFLWYRLMDLETIAHYPAMLVTSALRGRFTLVPTDHWLSQVGLVAWRPIELYSAIGFSAIFWLVLFSMLAHEPKHRRRLRLFKKKTLTTPVVYRGD